MSVMKIISTNFLHLFNKKIGHYGIVKKRKKMHYENSFEYIPSDYEKEKQQEWNNLKNEQYMKKERQLVPFDTSNISDENIMLMNTLVYVNKANYEMFKHLDSQYWKYIERLSDFRNTTIEDIIYIHRLFKIEGIKHDGINALVTILSINKYCEENGFVSFIPTSMIKNYIVISLKNTIFERLSQTSVVKRMDIKLY